MGDQHDSVASIGTGERPAAKAIRELLQFDVPCVGVFGDVVMVQRKGRAPDEEVLVLLHFTGEQGSPAARSAI